jgi:hypothetical protein
MSRSAIAALGLATCSDPKFPLTSPNGSHMMGSREFQQREWVVRRSSVAVFALMLTGMLMVAGPASADPKSGCPVGTGWEELTVETVAATVWPELLDQSPWTDQQDFQESAVRPYDRNEDGSLCMKTMWGEDLNPNSPWQGVLQFLPRDNSANASNS